MRLYTLYTMHRKYRTKQYFQHFSPAYLDAPPTINREHAALPLRNVPSVDPALDLYRGTLEHNRNSTILGHVALEAPAFHDDEARVLSEEHPAVLRALVLGKCPAQNADVSF